MRHVAVIALLAVALAGCAPRQDPGIPLPPKSTAVALMPVAVVLR